MKKSLDIFIAKTYEFVNRFVPVIETFKSTYLYGVDDLLPNNNLRYINDCGVAKRCVRKKARYIQGDGFASEQVSKIQVNPKHTADHLLRAISSYVAYNEGFSLQVRRDTTAKIVDVKCIPFQCVRKRTNADLTYNPKKGQQGFRDSDTTIHPEFRKEITSKQYAELMKAYKNQPEILYVYEETADNPNYPVPDYNAGIEDIQTCAEISKMDLELSVNGFMPSAILTTHKIDSVNKDDQGKTPYDYFAEEINKFTGKKKTYNPNLYSSRARESGDISLKEGLGGRFNLLHIMASSMAEAPKLDQYDAKTILEGTNSKRDVLAREVCRLFGVHPILAGFSDAQVLGNTQALANVIVELNSYINPIQRMISETFALLYPGQDWTITQFTPISYLPPELMEVLTDNEIREMFGYEPVEPEAIEKEKPDLHENGQPGKVTMEDDGTNN